MTAEAYGERRIVSVLVTDVVDSTGIAERLGSERSKVLFDEVARVTAEQVRLYGGTLAQHTGDGVLAVFGAPVAHGDDAERAVRAAAGVQEALRTLSVEVLAAYGVELAARASVNTGPAAIPSGEQPPDVLYNALGDTVNVAARLQAHAAPGGVVLGPVTANEVRDVFDVEPIGDLEIRGRGEPVEAYRLVGPRDKVDVPATPYVGRDADRALVVEALEEVVDGRGSVVVITGEAGIGKSRLITEATSMLTGRARVLEGQGVSYAESFPYWPVRALLRNWLDLPVAAPEAQVRLELRAGLNAALGEAGVEAYPFLAVVAGVPLEPDVAVRLRELPSDGVRQRTVEALQALLTQLAREKPLLVVLDDLHWADEATLEMVGELFDVVDEESFGLVLSYRTYRDHAAWRLGELARQRVPHRLREVELSGLTSGDSRTLTAALAGASLPLEVDEALEERAGGNPFFLEQALHDLVERGMLRRDGDTFTLHGPVDGAMVPWAVQETLQARLDRLDHDTRTAVSAASVLGRTFARPFLERLLDGVSLSGPLSELQRLDLIVETRRRPEAEYRFRHGLVQEVAYTSLLEDQRRALHRRVAELLEPIVDDCDEDLGLLGHHWAEAGDAERAARYLVRAGDAARRMYADAEAFGHYERAVAFQCELGDTAGARNTLLRLALARHQAFDFVGADTAWRDAFALPAHEWHGEEPTESLELPITVPESVIPGLTSFETSGWVARHVFAGLMRPAPDGGIVPDGASRVSVTPDGRTYRFGLQPSRWHDGAPVTAADYVFAFDSLVHGDGFGASLLQHFDSLTEVGELELELSLSRPLSHLPALLAQGVLFPWPQHLWATDGPPRGLRDPRLVGNGPFRVASYDGRAIRLEAATTWDRPRGNVAEVTMTVIRGKDSEINDLWDQGRFDLAVSINHEVDDDPMTVRHTFRKTSVQYLGLVAHGPLSDARVRLALIRALEPIPDEQASVRALGGLLPPAVLGHSHDLGVERDLEESARLLTEAGYPGGAGLRPLVLALPKELFNEIGREARYTDAWAEIGVQLEVRRPSMAVPFFDDEVDAWVMGWSADSPDPVVVLETFLLAYPMLAQDDELNALLGRAAASTDRDERILLCRAFERAWIAGLGALKPIRYGGAFAVTRPHVHGFWTSFEGAVTLDELTVTRQG